MSLEKKNILFIINPISGIGKKNIIPALIQEHLNEGDFSHEIVYTEYRNHGFEIASKEHEKFDAIIAVGGDGSVNEIGSALIHKECALGIIPAGSGNGLARHLKTPLKPAEAIKKIADFKKIKIDTGLVNEDVFLGTCGFGFDAHIAKKFDEYHKRGFISYAKLVMSEYKTYTKPTFIVKIGEKVIERESMMCSVANSSQFGNGFVISPESKIDDGKFELIFLEDFNLLNAPQIGTRFFTGSIHKSKKFECFQFDDSINIEVKGIDTVFYHLDGEPKSNGIKFELKVLKSSLNMI